MGVILIKPSNLGFYFDFRGGGIKGSDDPDFYENISVNKAENIFNDRFLGEDKGSVSISSGITRSITRYSAIYLGFAYTFFSYYRQYHDEFEILGNNGNYWIEDKEKSSSGISIIGGLLVPVSNSVVFQVGYSSLPNGVMLGVALYPKNIGWMHK